MELHRSDAPHHHPPMYFKLYQIGKPGVLMIFTVLALVCPWVVAGGFSGRTQFWAVHHREAAVVTQTHTTEWVDLRTHRLQCTFLSQNTNTTCPLVTPNKFYTSSDLSLTMARMGTAYYSIAVMRLPSLLYISSVMFGHTIPPFFERPRVKRCVVFMQGVGVLLCVLLGTVHALFPPVDKKQHDSHTLRDWVWNVHSVVPGVVWGALRIELTLHAAFLHLLIKEGRIRLFLDALCCLAVVFSTVLPITPFHPLLLQDLTWYGISIAVSGLLLWVGGYAAFEAPSVAVLSGLLFYTVADFGYYSVLYFAVEARGYSSFFITSPSTMYLSSLAVGPFHALLVYFAVFVPKEMERSLINDVSITSDPFVEDDASSAGYDSCGSAVSDGPDDAPDGDLQLHATLPDGRTDVVHIASDATWGDVLRKTASCANLDRTVHMKLLLDGAEVRGGGAVPISSLPLHAGSQLDLRVKPAADLHHAVLRLQNAGFEDSMFCRAFQRALHLDDTRHIRDLLACNWCVRQCAERGAFADDLALAPRVLQIILNFASRDIALRITEALVDLPQARHVIPASRLLQRSDIMAKLSFEASVMCMQYAESGPFYQYLPKQRVGMIVKGLARVARPDEAGRVLRVMVERGLVLDEELVGACAQHDVVSCPWRYYLPFIGEPHMATCALVACGEVVPPRVQKGVRMTVLWVCLYAGTAYHVISLHYNSNLRWDPQSEIPFAVFLVFAACALCGDVVPRSVLAVFASKQLRES